MWRKHIPSPKRKGDEPLQGQILRGGSGGGTVQGGAEGAAQGVHRQRLRGAPAQRQEDHAADQGRCTIFTQQKKFSGSFVETYGF